MKELQESDLQIGDILIFENQDFDITKFYDLMPDWKDIDNKEQWMPAAFYALLYMIPWFDPGDEGSEYKNIYHAAIWGNVNVYRGENRETKNEHRIVQAGSSGIGQADMDGTLKGHGVKNIYVYRHNEKTPNFDSEVNNEIWNFYDNVAIPYAYKTAWLLAVICTLRYPDGKLKELLNNYMPAYVADMMVLIIQDWINDYNNQHEDEMVVCSTLVAMIYKNAGHELRINALSESNDLAILEHFEMKEGEGTPNIDANHVLTGADIKGTVVTPRQLAESPDVHEVGYLPHRTS
jgi:hypothetical protein